ncbi:LysR family transcriptional regulator [Alcaligenes sp. 13f]|uniref:LysR family transcriptional regulator n=1 Tax=Alcaligenes sp. 13f TaxID=2841924 RepID=UPI001CF6FAC6|nr:LysR family transcriptional regulator [Alcaligenes sp. 13f]MCB4321567.1 LysR family transcriptional regulator [Alcaligenes sp. 13f]
MDWDNLRYFLELARTETLAAAARRIGVEHTTVARRVLALEKQMGASLFSREPGGHRLTEAGRRLLPAAIEMESAIFRVEGVRAEDGQGPSGLVRIGCTEGFGTRILAPHLVRLRQRHPSLSIDLLALPRMLQLSRREADIIISLERPTRSSVIVAKLTDYALYLYGQRQYLLEHPPVTNVQDLSQHPLINYVDDFLFTRELQLLEELYKPERFVFRSTSLLAQHAAVCAGAGLAVLPAFIADGESKLVRVLPEQANFTRTFWMSMPEEARHQPRIHVVWDFLKEVSMKEQSNLLPS